MKAVSSFFEQQCELDFGFQGAEQAVRERAAIIISKLFQHPNINVIHITDHLKQLRRKKNLNFGMIIGKYLIQNFF